MPRRKTDLDIMGDGYIADQQGKLIYSRSQWWEWGGAVWQPRHDLLQDREAWNVLKDWRDKDGQAVSRIKKDGLLNYLKSRIFVPDEMLDAHSHLINLQNGVYDLEDQQLLPHDPQYYMTTILPFGYNPAATCPMWQKYLITTFVEPNSTTFDPELAYFVQEAIGYSLTTDISHHVAFWCLGEGANGKGTLFHVLEQLGGTGVTTLNVDLLRKEQYQLANLAGKRMALCSESKASNNLVEDALIKALVAGDTMNVRQIRREPFELHPMLKLWWSMNEFPAVADTTEGFWRRVRIIPFNRVFEPDERILDLKPQLDEELSGIFNWAMLGLERLRKDEHFTEAKQVTRETNARRRDANPVELFVEDNCLVGNRYKVSISALYNNYKNWSTDNGFRPHSISNFKQEVSRLKAKDPQTGGNVLIYDKRESAGVFMLGICISLNPTFAQAPSVSNAAWQQANLH